MMLLPVLRPVQKSASRLLLASAAEISTDHGVPLEVQPPATAVYHPNWGYAAMHNELSSRQMNVLAQPIWGGRWPVAVENVLAQGSGSSRSSNQEQAQTPAAQADEFTQELQDGQLASELGWLVQPRSQSRSPAPAPPRWQPGRPEKSQPVLPGLVNRPRAVEQAELCASPTSEGPGQLWPPTPEFTPPCSPREYGAPMFAAFPGIWHIEIPSMVLPEPVAPPEMKMQVEEVPDAEAQACERMISQLDGDAGRAEVMEMLCTSAWSMACTPGGTRVVQKALEVADTAERISLAEQLQGHVKEAFASPHANHVLQKCIELIPPDRLHFVLSEMLGHAVAAARHRYGCRVLERLLEHCPSEQTAPLVEEVLAGAPQLCRHTFGNFVVQHVLEHGTVSQKHQIVDVIHADIQRLARHRVASHVVRCALKHSTPEDRQKLVQAIRKDPADLADLAHHHCGSFVVREMRRSDSVHR